MPLALKIFLATIYIASAAFASTHAIIYKREPRAATLWALVAWLLPFFGPFLYLMFGINRVRREAAALRRDMVRHRTTPDSVPCSGEGAFLAEHARHLAPLAQLGCRVTDRQLVPGNKIKPLHNAPDVFKAMLEAIANAKGSVAFSTYIFDATGIGHEFIEAFQRAHQRGVQVRILIDAVGSKYSRPRAFNELKKRGVPAALFNPPLISPWITAFNLRNHRKILVVDGKLGFTGGLNIKCEYSDASIKGELFSDSHFQIEGPVIAHISEVFVDDWQFATSEALRGPAWFPHLHPLTHGGIARGIEAGPDESYDRIRWVIIGALNSARKSIRIATPYFIPDTAIVSALSAAALRGVEVDVLLPQKLNLPYVQWAATGQLWQTLERGCRVWVNPGAFDHSKIFVIDSSWSMIGSANWDGRSLRLNFEFNLESYDPEFAALLDKFFDERLLKAIPITHEVLNARPWPIKLRDGFARLFAPYL